jgi:hypothetical protein
MHLKDIYSLHEEFKIIFSLPKVLKLKFCKYRSAPQKLQ